MSTEKKGCYDRKVVCCGNVLEVYEYKEPIKCGYKNKHIWKCIAPLS